MKTLIELNNKVDPDISSDAISVIVTLPENGLPIAILIANNDKGKNYLQNIKLYDTLTIKFAYEDTGNINWDSVEPIFKGKVIEVNPTMNVRGETISVTAITGECLKQMRVSQEYGVQADVYVETTVNPSSWIEWYHQQGWCHTTVLFGPGHFEAVQTFNVEPYSRILFHKACVYHQGAGSVTIYYRFGDESRPWIQIGNPISGGFDCRFPDGTNESDYVIGGLGEKLQVKWRLEVPLFQTGCMGNFYVYYNYSQNVFNYIDTLREILCDETYGIVPKYIEKILASNESSGYTLNTDYVYEYPEKFNYLNFPYVDALYCLNEICKVSTAMDYVKNKSEYRGLHWILLPNAQNDTPYLLIAPIGKHDVYGKLFIESKWPSHYPNELIVKEDMIRKQFKTEVPLANYVLVAGKYVYPINEKWTELNASIYWDAHTYWIAGSSYVTKETVNPAIGQAYVRLNAQCGNASIYFGFKVKEQLNIEKLYNSKVPFYIGFYSKSSDGITDLRLCFFKDWDNYIYTTNISSGRQKWVKNEIEVNIADNTTWIKNGNVEWSDVKYVGIMFKNTTASPVFVDIDNLQIIGNVIRGAYTESTSNTHNALPANECEIGCIHHFGCRMYTVKDSLAQTDNLDPNDDSNALAQVALYELLRHRVPRTTGSVEIPLTLDILPGQIIHVKACERVADNGSVIGYKIDKDFRITKVEHKFSVEGCTTTLELTDDLRNGLPVNTQDPYTVILRAVNPDTQTKTYASLKASGSFFTNLKVISKNYPQ